MAKEVEIKFFIRSLPELRRRLRASGFRLVTPRTHEMNLIYDFPDGALRRRGELLRLRHFGRTWTLTHKSQASIGRHKVRLEQETQVHDGKTMEAVLLTLGLRETFCYEKFRAEWSDGKGHVVLDETPIGNFAEIEGRAGWIDATAKKLKVSQSDYLTASYAELFIRWKAANGSQAQEMTWKALKKRGP